MIDELKKLIEIDSPSPCTSSLFLKQDYRNFHNENYPSLLLKIRKRQSAIKEALHDLGDSIGLENTYRYRKKNFEYIVMKDRYDYQFFAHNEVNGPQFYNPSVFIKNNKEFKELYSELQKGVLFKVPEVDLSLNHFQCSY